jgi:chaperone BCS1
METLTSDHIQNMRPTSSHQVSMLDVFIPGFSLASTAAEQLLTGDLSLYAYLACIFGVCGVLSDYVSRLVSWLQPSLS